MLIGCISLLTSDTERQAASVTSRSMSVSSVLSFSVRLPSSSLLYSRSRNETRFLHLRARL